MAKRKKVIFTRMVCLLVLAAIGIVGGLGSISDARNREVKQIAGEELKMQITDLKVQNLSDPIGIQTEKPVLSWKLTSEEAGQKQTAYRIVAATTEEKLEGEDYDIWDSGKVESSDNYGIVYGGRTLKSMERVYWKVIVWDKDGNEISFSDTAYWEMGLLDKSDWQGKWITAGSEPVLYGDADQDSSKAKVNNILSDSVGEITTRYFKLRVMESGPASIDEYNDANLGGVIYRVQIMELEFYKNGEKIALPVNTKVTAANSFSWGSQWDINALIDRNYAQGYTSNTAASPSYDNPIEVVLDFGTEVTFDEIKLYCRTDARSTEGEICPNYPKRYQYLQSEDGGNYQKISDEIVVTEAPVINGDEEPANAPILSKEFDIQDEKKVVSGRLYISGLGLFEAHFNGVTLGEGTYFNPGESDARDTVYYCTYDITDYLNADETKGWKNAVSFLLGNGQYSNYRIHRQLGRYYKTDDSRSEVEVEGMFGAVKGIAQIVITYEDGSRTTIGTDDSWSYVESPITENSWYGGEDYDATLEIEGWDNINPAVPRSEWGKAVLVGNEEIPKGSLRGREFEPIFIQQADTISSERIEVEKLSESDGHTTYLVDMGRNGAGFQEITLENTKRGQQVRMYPAEVDAMTGYMGHINQASCTQSASNNGDLIYDTYIAKGGEKEVWHPRFCYHGYRYLEVSVPSEIELTSDNFKGYILRTDNDKNGSFSSSDESLNQINVLTERSIESNMYSTFTDCPQIEKLGWLETPSLMYYSMSHTYDISSWIPKLIQDMEDAQYSNGRIAAIAPEYFKIGPLSEDLNWNGSIILTSWQYYETYGNKEIFSDGHYQTMKNYMDYLEKDVARNNLILTGQMGEWGEMTNYGTTPVVLVETTAYYRMAVAMGKIAGVLGESADQEHYTRLAEAIQKAFHENKTCYNETNLYGNGTQSGYGCVLYSGIVLEENREETVKRLVKAIENTDYHLTSGEVGLKQVFSALAENGRSDIVYKMVTNETMPSYQYFLEKGLTTLPEYWNFEDLWNGSSRSLNHAMMGHVKEWFTRYLAGVQLEDIAYDSVRIKPAVLGELNEVNGTVDTVHGNIISNWKMDRENNTLVMEITLPVGVSASVYVPVIGTEQTVTCNGNEVSVSGTEAGYMLLKDVLESGFYTITTNAVPFLPDEPEEINKPDTSAKTLEKNGLALSAKLKVSQKGNKINVVWGKVSGADGYDVYVQYNGKQFTSKSRNSVKRNKVTKLNVKKVNGKKLDLKKSYKVYVTAYKLADRKKVAIGRSITAYITGRKNAKYTNAKAVKINKVSYTLKAGKTATIKARTVLVHPGKKLSGNGIKEFRYASSNKNIATVSGTGKIKAVKKGSCIIYVYARNGYGKKIKVTVK